MSSRKLPQLKTKAEEEIEVCFVRTLSDMSMVVASVADHAWQAALRGHPRSLGKCPENPSVCA